MRKTLQFLKSLNEYHPPSVGLEHHIVLYDDKMVHKILLWIGLYILLFIIGFIGENIYPLVDYFNIKYK